MRSHLHKITNNYQRNALLIFKDFVHKSKSYSHPLPGGVTSQGFWEGYATCLLKSLPHFQTKRDDFPTHLQKWPLIRYTDQNGSKTNNSRPYKPYSSYNGVPQEPEPPHPTEPPHITQRLTSGVRERQLFTCLTVPSRVLCIARAAVTSSGVGACAAVLARIVDSTFVYIWCKNTCV